MRLLLHRNKVRVLVGSLALGLLAGLSLVLQVELERRDLGRAAKIEQLRLLPRGEILRPALLGYHQFGADLVWLRVVQVLGDRVVRDQDYAWLYHALDVITTLDQKYIYAYEAGGTVLAELASRVDLSNQLLEKGLEPNPTAWQIPFRLGFNHFFHLSNHLQAAEFMARAAKVPGQFPVGPPAYTARLASRLYAQGKNPEVAIEFLQAMLDQTADEDVREQLRRRIKRVMVERDLQLLERAVAQYREARKKTPQSLAELVTSGTINTIPDEPYGGVYRLDLQTGEVSSSTHSERVRAYQSSDSLATRGDIE